MAQMKNGEFTEHSMEERPGEGFIDENTGAIQVTIDPKIQISYMPICGQDDKARGKMGHGMDPKVDYINQQMEEQHGKNLQQDYQPQNRALEELVSALHRPTATGCMQLLMQAPWVEYTEAMMPVNHGEEFKQIIVCGDVVVILQK
jgi:hypothetical protein